MATPAVPTPGPAAPSHVTLKVAVVGDAATGKTALLERYPS